MRTPDGKIDELALCGFIVIFGVIGWFIYGIATGGTAAQREAERYRTNINKDPNCASFITNSRPCNPF